MGGNGPVTRADLPQFTVASVEEGERDSDGLIEWRLRGRLNRVDRLRLDGRLFVLLMGKSSLTGDFSQPRGERQETTFTAWDKTRPAVEGQSLACVDAYYKYQVWSVEDGPAAWEEGVFAASDAIASRFVGTDGQTYRRTRQAGAVRATAIEARADSHDDEGPTWIIPGGWNHEHCAICNAHIDPGDRYFFHAGYNQYLCAECYLKYVLTGSIEFALPPEEERSNGEEAPPK